ncbi:MAG: uridine diphosphate-N-acetylglucosamine-binding protein YvcK [Planctomycetota bacterium]
MSASQVTAKSSETRRDRRIVAFGGGTGMAALLRGLKEYSDHITAVVTVTDNGGSSGRLRSEFEMAAPGDLRNCLLALADVDPLISRVFQYRFHEAEFKGHCFGNLFITVLNRVVGDFKGSIEELNRLLRVRGRVIPACEGRVSLVAHHPDGSKSTGEVQITKSGKPIDRIELQPQPVPLDPEIAEAVAEADLFLFGPGSLYTSIIPNLLIGDLMDRIRATGKPSVYVGNIMTQPGETVGYDLGDHIRALRRHVGDGFPDAVVAHNGRVPPEISENYRREGAGVVRQDLDDDPDFRNVRVVQRNFLAEDAVSSGRSARHDSSLLARVIFEEFVARVDGSDVEPSDVASSENVVTPENSVQ